MTDVTLDVFYNLNYFETISKSWFDTHLDKILLCENVVWMAGICYIMCILYIFKCMCLAIGTSSYPKYCKILRCCQ